MNRKNARLILPIISVLAFGLFWHFSVMFLNIPDWLIPSPAAVLKSAHEAALARRAMFDQDNALLVGMVAQDDPSLVSGDGVRYFFDNDLAVSRTMGVTDGQAYVPMVFLLDRALRVVMAEPIARLDTVLDLLEKLLAMEAPNLIEQSAPVLTIPRVFEPALCDTLIKYYKDHGGDVSGFMREVEGETKLMYDDTHKRRRDVTIEDVELRAAVRLRIERRLLPMIERAFAWRATQIERYLVSCYGEDQSGFFAPHRDNTTPGTAHRKFAVSINLNADYDGGLLRFPEFGTRAYKPPLGRATVFSCGLLHEATPVTRGQRFAFLPFLYDEAAAKIRQANLHMVKVEQA